MLVLVIILAALGVVVGLASLLSQKGGDAGNDVVMPAKNSCATCSGSDPRCEQLCMLEAAVKDVEYYDDEELDKYRGRSSDSYSDEETDEFADVLYTLRPDDVKGWSRSLTLRGINIPDGLKDELIMMIDDSARTENAAMSDDNKTA